MSTTVRTNASKLCAWRMRDILPTLLLFLFAAMLAHSESPADSSSRFRFPVQFTRNDGQWAGDIRYAVLHKADGFELLRDGIRTRPSRDGGADLPDVELPHRDEVESELRFVSPSPGMYFIRMIGAAGQATRAVVVR